MMIQMRAGFPFLPQRPEIGPDAPVHMQLRIGILLNQFLKSQKEVLMAFPNRQVPRNDEFGEGRDVFLFSFEKEGGV